MLLPLLYHQNRKPQGAFRVNHHSSQFRGLLSWWQVLASAGTNTLLDLVGNFNGAFPGGNEDPIWTSIVDRDVALNFVSDDYVSFASGPGVIGSDAGTVSFWVYYTGNPTSDQESAIYSNSSATHMFEKGFQVNAWSWYINNWSLSTTTAPFSLNTWTHITLIWTATPSTYREIFVNAVSNISSTGWFGQGAATISRIGQRGNASTKGFKGFIDDFRLYDRMLSGVEIGELYQNPWDLYVPVLPSIWVVGSQALVGDFSINVADSVALADSSSSFIPFVLISKVESVAIVDAPTAELVSFVAVTDAVAVAEVVVIAVEVLDLQVVVTDSVSVADSVTMQGPIVYDLIPGVSSIVAAYGVRRLFSSYDNYLIRILRNSDDALLNVGFDANGDLDVAAIATFLGGGTGSIATWYDQSGGGRNATQTTEAFEPLYLASGINSKPNADFDGVNDRLDLPALWANTGDSSYLFVIESDNVSTEQRFFSYNEEAGYVSMRFNSGGANIYFSVIQGPEVSVTSTVLETDPILCTFVVDEGVNINGFVNGNAMTGNGTAIGTLIEITPVARKIGSSRSNTLFLNGRIGEILIADVVWTTEQRQAAEAIANAYWFVEAEPSISVADAVGVGEAVSVAVSDLNVSVVESIAVGEDATVSIPTLILSVSDGVSVSEIVSVNPNRFSEFFNFTTGGIPVSLLQRTNGVGVVSVVGGELVLDTGGSAVGDCAAVVYDTPVDLTKYTIVAVACDVAGPVMGSYSMNILGLYDSAGAPIVMSTATRQAQEVIWLEDQYSTTDNFERWELRYRDPAATVYYGRSDETWSSTFGVTITEMHRDSTYVAMMIIDGPNNRVRWDFLGRTEGSQDANQGYSIVYSSEWVAFGASVGNIDEVENLAWVVVGDLVNDKSVGYDIQYKFDWMLFGEVNEADISQFAWTNLAASGAFPFPYDIYALVNPVPDQFSYWTPVERIGLVPAISRGANDWVKDPSVFDNTEEDGKYYMVYQTKASGGDGSLYVAEATSLLHAVWSSHTQIVATGVGEDKAEFPYLTRKPGGGDWVLFYDVENDIPEWRIYVRTSANSTPYSGWSAATELLDTTGSAEFDDDGSAQPFPVWLNGGYDDGIWAIYYAAASGSPSTVWRGHYAVSTTGFDGVYTKGAGGPVIDATLFNSAINGAVTRNRQLILDTTTGLVAGQILLLSGDQIPVSVESVDSGTQITVPIEVSLNDNVTVRSVTNYSLAPRSLRRIDGVWYAWVTTFKYPGGQEYGFLLVDPVGEVDPRDVAWREILTTDDLYTFTLVIPKRATTLAAENIGFVWPVLTSLEVGDDLSVSVSDSISVTESVAIVLPDLHIVVADSATVTEAIDLEFVSHILVIDSVAVAEAVTVILSDLQVIAADSISVSDSVSVLVIEAGAIVVSVSDTVQVSETVSLLLIGFVTVVDLVAVGEQVEVGLVSFVAVTDAIVVNESVFVSILASVSVLDSVAVTEVVSAIVSDSQIVVVDSISVTEVVTILTVVQGLLVVSVSDLVTVGEGLALQISDPQVVVLDTILVLDTASVFIVEAGVVIISVSDTIGVAEQIVAVVSNPQVDIFDSIIVGETVGLELFTFVSVVDSITIADSVLIGFVLTLTVLDTVTIGESTTAIVSSPQIDVDESITVIDTATLIAGILGIVQGRLFKGMYRGMYKGMR